MTKNRLEWSPKPARSDQSELAIQIHRSNNMADSGWSRELSKSTGDAIKWMLCALSLFIVFVAGGVSVWAAPHAEAGDTELRHDLEYLADRGLISIPITTWPMSWADINAAADSVDKSSITHPATRAVLKRIESRVATNSRWGQLELSYNLGVSENRSRLRTFSDQPRGSVEVGSQVEYTGRTFVVNLELELVDDSLDSQDVRIDGSYIGALFGNVAVTFGSQDAWWGPGHAGSLILSNNARPVPGIAVRRNEALAFKSPLLRWLGPWSAHGFAGRLESGRPVSQPYFLGLRVTAKPLRSLELGVSRTAQWGGRGRPETFSSLVDMILGRDNIGDGVDASNEPGNQLAGFDVRWSTSRLYLPITLYGQMIGEDEAGGFPSRYLGQGGVSTSFAGPLSESTVRLNLEYSDTTCQFNKSTRFFNCAYNSGTYPDGYRYRGTAIGHSTDNDSSQIALLATFNTGQRQSWQLALRSGRLNRDGPPDLKNSLTPTRKDYFDLDLQHSRPFYAGKVEFGLGVSDMDSILNNSSTTDFRFFARWYSMMR